jgi:hypothetical protein
MKMCPGCETPTKCKAAKKCLGPKVVKKKTGGSFPDLTGDGKVTKADVLKGRGVKAAKMGGKMKGYRSGGKIDGCAMRGRTRGRTV